MSPQRVNVGELKNIYMHIFLIKKIETKEILDRVQEKALCGNKFQYVHLGFG